MLLPFIHGFGVQKPVCLRAAYDGEYASIYMCVRLVGTTKLPPLFSWTCQYLHMYIYVVDVICLSNLKSRSRAETLVGMGMPRLFRISDGLLLRLCVARTTALQSHRAISKIKSLRKVSVLTYGMDSFLSVTSRPTHLRWVAQPQLTRDPGPSPLTVIGTPSHYLFA